MKLADPDREWRIEENFFRTQHGVDVEISWRPGKSFETLQPMEA